MAMVQLQSYGFTTVENPLSDSGNFTTAPALSAPRVPSSGVCEPSVTLTGCGSFWSGKVVQTGDSWPADQYSEITIKTVATNTSAIFLPQVRMSASAQTWYQCNLTGLGITTQQVYKLVNGSPAQLGSNFTATVAVNDVWRITASGSTITVSQNGTVLFTATDTAITSGSPGFQLYDGTAIADAQISLWAAGANQAATPTFNPVAGSYATAQNVKISSSTPGGLIYYTTDGSTPTHSSSSIANGGTVTVSTPLTIKAFASVTNFADSATGSAAYTGSLTPGSNSSWLSVNNQQCTSWLT